MMYRLNPRFPSRLALMSALMGALSSPLALAQAMPSPTTQASTSPTVVNARIDGLLSNTDAVRALPGNVLCRDEALRAGGSWLVVSRSWGGSPSLRHRQLVAWPAGQALPAGRVNVAWRDCGKQT
jgi:hypothetical protein